METLLAMLRGINVSGQKKVPMAELKAMFEDMKFKNVRTYIQSGNVLFESNATDAAALSKKISKKIMETFGFDVPVVVVNKKELENAITKNPFVKEKNVVHEKLYFTFLAEAPPKELEEKISLPEGSSDRYSIAGTTVYLYCPGGYGETKLSNNFFESKLKIKATTRNWRTTNELLKLMTEK
ncbi:MAG TPA: DUF1697 domain-containing protein [Bacteroidia bacterium]|jgi:uncharacterized protein (DUF1697 family)